MPLFASQPACRQLGLKQSASYMYMYVYVYVYVYVCVYVYVYVYAYMYITAPAVKPPCMPSTTPSKPVQHELTCVSPCRLRGDLVAN